jgi:hypothetical protein
MADIQAGASIAASSMATPGVGGFANLFNEDQSTTGKILGFVDPTGVGSAVCGGKSKSKPKPWANLPGGKLSWRGEKILKAGNYLLPATLDLTRRGAEGFGDIYRSEAAKTREDELKSFEEYGPRYAEALDAADPARKRAKEIILANLDEGLDPAIAREIEQGSRAAFSSRGMLNSPASAIMELFNRGTRAKAIEDANVGRALELSRGRDAFMAYSGRPSAPQGSNPMSPNYSSYSNDLPSFMANDEMMRFNAAQAAKDRQTQLIGAGIGALGSAAGGAMSFV